VCSSDLGYEGSADTLVSAVKYGGQSLTRINGVVVGNFDRIELWYLKDAGIAAATTGTFVVTYGGANPTDQHFASAFFQNVLQTAPISASNVNSTNAATPNPLPTSIAVTADGMAVAASICGNTGSFTWNNGWTEGIDQSLTSSNSTAADHPATANVTDSASATHSHQNKQAVVAAALAVAR
jgi:hypothetical protein